MGMSYQFYIGPFAAYKPPKVTVTDEFYTCMNVGKCKIGTLKKFKEEGFCSACGNRLASCSTSRDEELHFSTFADEEGYDDWFDKLCEPTELQTNLLYDNQKNKNATIISLDCSTDFPDEGFVSLSKIDREKAVEDFKKKYNSIFKIMEENGFKLKFDYGLVVDYL